MSTAYRQIVINGPWVEIARLDAHEWFRDHPGAPLCEFDQWVDEYEVATLRGSGHQGGRLTAQLQEILDDVHVGLADAVEGRQRWALRSA